MSAKEGELGPMKGSTPGAALCNIRRRANLRSGDSHRYQEGLVLRTWDESLETGDPHIDDELDPGMLRFWVH